MPDSESPSPYTGDYEWPSNLYTEMIDMAVRCIMHKFKQMLAKDLSTCNSSANDPILRIIRIF